MKLKLEDVIEAIDSVGFESTSYYNKITGEIVTKYDSMLTGFVDEALETELETNWEQYITLPDSFEINEYEIMESFIWKLDDELVSNKLDRAIRGRGAFRRFKDMVYELGLGEQWYSYLDDAHKQIAIKWCKDNQIEFED